MGIDLGQRRDHTAVAIVERRDLVRPYGTPVFESVLVRHLERVAFGYSLSGSGGKGAGSGCRG